MAEGNPYHYMPLGFGIGLVVGYALGEMGSGDQGSDLEFIVSTGVTGVAIFGLNTVLQKAIMKYATKDALLQSGALSVGYAIGKCTSRFVF